MSEQLVKKLYNNKATIDDVAEIKQHITPKHQGFMVPHGMAGNPFFISAPIGVNNGKNVGIILTINSIASYSGKLGDKMVLDMKYLNGINKNSIIHLNGSMNDEFHFIEGRISYNKDVDDYYGFYLLPSVDEKLFYSFLKNNLG